MLTDNELRIYLHELGVLHSNEKALHENSRETSKELFQELAHQFIEDKKEKPFAIQENLPPPQEKEKTKSFLRIAAITSVFFGGLIVGFLIGSIQKSPLEKLTADLQKAVKAFEELDFDKLNPASNKEHMISPLQLKNEVI